MRSLFLYMYHLNIIAGLCTRATSSTSTESPIQKSHRKTPQLKQRTSNEESPIDYGSLRTCKNKSNCLPWQVCASCKTKTFGVTVKYCSDYSVKGLCNHGDEKMICSCSETPLNPALYPKQMIGAVEGYCETDEDCERQYAPLLAPGLGFRCATCVVDKVQGKIYSWRSLCSKPSDEVLDHCSAAWADTCSCGQLKAPPPTTMIQSSDQRRHGDDTVTPENNLLRPHAQIPANMASQDERISLPGDGNLASSFLANSPDAAPQDSFFGFFSGNSYQVQDSPDVDNGGDRAF